MEENFVNNVISELVTLSPELKIVHGKPRHSQNQGSVERANQDLENMMSSWLKDKNSTKWSEGLTYVQFMKNRAFHLGIKQSPHKALFGIEPRVGLSTSSLLQEIINDLQDKDDLRKVIEDDSNSNHSEDGDGGVVEIDTQNIKDARITAAKNLKKQAKKMKAFFDKSHSPANIGDNVTIPIPDVDKGRGDLRNIIGVIFRKNDEDLYKVGTKHGVLQKLYYRYRFFAHCIFEAHFDNTYFE
ncbi:uncharacterized protein [Leptinotarsa decemlineata]|uniref:uncharacterized protein n=1 Tax=Leptinotarsa decemlineata TaxID=7539 RepID=UPI003D304434